MGPSSIVGALGMSSGGGEVVRAMTSSLRGAKLELTGHELFFSLHFLYSVLSQVPRLGWNSYLSDL